MFRTYLRQLGQSTSQYLGATALIAIATIGVVGLFGDSLQTQFSDLAVEIAGSNEQSEERSNSSSDELLEPFDENDQGDTSFDGNSDDNEANETERVQVAAWPWGAAKALQCAKTSSCRKAVKEGAKQAVKKGRDALKRNRDADGVTKGAAKPSPKFKPPTNPAQHPPTKVPAGWRVREMPPTKQYPNGYWKLEKPMKDGSWQPIDPSTMKPGGRPETHVPFPPKGS